MDIQKNILVVDDNRQNRLLLCNILNLAGYETIQAENGQEAYEKLCAASTEISLVLLDIVMPVLDGYGLLQRMNESGLITSIPVIAMTGNESEETEIRCLAGGASDFLRKPYNAKLVRHRVDSLLRLWENATLLSRLERDRLTDLYNKEAFFRHAEELLEQHPDDDYDLIYSDIDGFKMINARYGNAVGDELLKFLAAHYSRQAGDQGVCGRIGADIFAILKRGEESRTQEEIGRVLAAEMKDAPVKGVSFKCGIFRVRDRSISIPDMCDRAKLALETIKNQYGVYYSVYDDSLRNKALRDHQLANGMEDALEKKQFLVYLQPKHDTETGAVAGVEALVRWEHPDLGFILPGEFIPLFEKNGFISKLDYYMWTEVCKLLKCWIKAGRRPVPVSVNASRADFSVFNLPQKIERLVDAYGLPHELLHFEVTESAYTENPAQLIAAVSSLRNMGFKIEMDDFGSGYSSLNMLSELPIDILKLDMRFLQSGSGHARAEKRNILSFIISLSKWLQLTTVAEGVETREEVDMLKTMGCNYIQGYYYAKPMPVYEFEEYLKAKTGRKRPPAAESAGIELPMQNTGEKRKPLVLAVEDIETNRAILRELLRRSYHVVLAENGAVANRYLQKHSSEIDCILLDLLMPVMDGFQLLEIIRGDETLRKIPVIITTETGGNSELRALHLGADSFVAKPYDPEILLHHVKKAVEQKRFWEIKRQFEQESGLLYRAAYRDELTELLNRHGLKSAIAHLPDGKQHAEIMLDVDHLKAINDTYGHTVGDEIIKTVAQVLKLSTRSGDIVSRVGGDEFVVILRGTDDLQAALKKAQHLCRAIQRSKIPSGALSPSCSAGITLMSKSENYGEVYERVDQALYKAKQSNKGACCLVENDALN